MKKFKDVDFSELVGETIVDIIPVIECSMGNKEEYVYELIFKTENKVFRMFHDQKCCEEVIWDSDQDLDDLSGEKIVFAEKTYFGDQYELFTYYKIRTIKNSFTISWRGRGDGNYSLEVFFQRMLSKEDIFIGMEIFIRIYGVSAKVLEIMDDDWAKVEMYGQKIILPIEQLINNIKI